MTDPGDQPLTFGTAGLRGPMRPGPGGMNVETVTAATWGLTKVLEGSATLGGSTDRGGPRRTAQLRRPLRMADRRSACRRRAFPSVLLPDPAPTPVVAFAVRRSRRGTAGVQITASHNPPSDNGYKVYLDGGMQIVPPSDREIEAAMAAAPHGRVPRTEVMPRRTPGSSRTTSGRAERGAAVDPDAVRVALTPLHGVGGEPALRVTARGGHRPTCTSSQSSSRPTATFRPSPFPNPEETGSHRPAAGAGRRGRRRCRHRTGSRRGPLRGRHPDRRPGWRMLSGDETGWLLGEYILVPDRSRRGGGPQPWSPARSSRPACWPRSPKPMAPSTSRR